MPSWFEMNPHTRQLGRPLRWVPCDSRLPPVCDLLGPREKRRVPVDEHKRARRPRRGSECSGDWKPGDEKPLEQSTKLQHVPAFVTGVMMIDDKSTVRAKACPRFFDHYVLTGCPPGSPDLGV